MSTSQLSDDEAMQRAWEEQRQKPRTEYSCPSREDFFAGWDAAVRHERAKQDALR